MKGLINIKKKIILNAFFGAIRHLNPLKINPERITKADKNRVNDLDFEGIKFLVSKKIIAIKQKNNVCIKLPFTTIISVSLNQLNFKLNFTVRPSQTVC